MKFHHQSFHSFTWTAGNTKVPTFKVNSKRALLLYNRLIIKGTPRCCCRRLLFQRKERCHILLGKITECFSFRPAIEDRLLLCTTGIFSQKKRSSLSNDGFESIAKFSNLWITSRSFGRSFAFEFVKMIFIGGPRITTKLFPKFLALRDFVQSSLHLRCKVIGKELWKFLDTELETTQTECSGSHFVLFCTHRLRYCLFRRWPLAEFLEFELFEFHLLCRFVFLFCILLFKECADKRGICTRSANPSLFKFTNESGFIETCCRSAHMREGFESFPFEFGSFFKSNRLNPNGGH